jgi:ribosomal protein L4
VLSGDVLIVDSFDLDEPKTRGYVKLINGLSGNVRRTLVISTKYSENTILAARNVAITPKSSILKLKAEKERLEPRYNLNSQKNFTNRALGTKDLLATAESVNTENLLAFDKIIITKDALEALGNRLQG